MGSSFAFVLYIALLFSEYFMCRAQNFKPSPETPLQLHLAAQNGQVNLVEELIRNGVDVNAEDNMKHTALHRAAQFGHDKIVEILLQNGANANAENSHRLSALHLAAANGYVKVLEVLLRNGANPNVMNAINWTPSHSAAQNGHDKAIQVLAENGADINAMNSINGSPLHLAIENGNEKVVEALLRNGVNVNARNKEGKTPFDIATNRGNAKVRELLETATTRPAKSQIVIGFNKVPLVSELTQIVPQIVPQVVQQTTTQSTPQKVTQMTAQPTKPTQQTKPSQSSQSAAQMQRPAHKACEVYSNLPRNRIFGGDPVEAGEFPWMSALGYLSETYQISFDCGGTIISDRFILTAAHCVKSSREPVVVRLGKITLTDTDGIRPANHQIQDIIRHPKFSILTKKDDIALIRLKKVITFTVEIVPACLQTDLRDERPEVRMIVTGWGVTSFENYERSNELRKAQVKTMPLSECNDVVLKYNTRVNLPAYRNGIGQSQYCAYDPQGKNDSCQGDSGGPLQYFPTADALAVVVGVVSFGVSCGSELPAFYTRVAYYLDWIESMVWPSAQ